MPDRIEATPMPIHQQDRQLTLIPWLAVFGAVATGVALVVATAVTLLVPNRGLPPFALGAGVTAVAETGVGAWLLRRRSRH